MRKCESDTDTMARTQAAAQSQTLMGHKSSILTKWKIVISFRLHSRCGKYCSTCIVCFEFQWFVADVWHRRHVCVAQLRIRRTDDKNTIFFFFVFISLRYSCYAFMGLEPDQLLLLLYFCAHDFDSDFREKRMELDCGGDRIIMTKWPWIK